MAQRGKLVATVAVVVGVAVLIGVGVAGEERLRELWWLGKLRSEDPEAQRLATSRLVALGSSRATPELLRLGAALNPSDGSRWNWAWDALLQIGGHGKVEALPFWIDALGSAGLSPGPPEVDSSRLRRAIDAIPRDSYDPGHVSKGLQDPPWTICPP